MEGFRVATPAGPMPWAVLPSGTAAQDQFYERRRAMFSAFAEFVAEGRSVDDLFEEIEGTANTMRIAVLTARPGA